MKLRKNSLFNKPLTAMPYCFLVFFICMSNIGFANNVFKTKHCTQTEGKNTEVCDECYSNEQNSLKNIELISKNSKSKFNIDSEISQFLDWRIEKKIEEANLIDKCLDRPKSFGCKSKVEKIYRAAQKALMIARVSSSLGTPDPYHILGGPEIALRFKESHKINEALDKFSFLSRETKKTEALSKDEKKLALRIWELEKENYIQNFLAEENTKARGYYTRCIEKTNSKNRCTKDALVETFVKCEENKTIYKLADNRICNKKAIQLEHEFNSSGIEKIIGKYQYLGNLSLIKAPGVFHLEGKTDIDYLQNDSKKPSNEQLALLKKAQKKYIKYLKNKKQNLVSNETSRSFVLENENLLDSFLEYLSSKKDGHILPNNICQKIQANIRQIESTKFNKKTLLFLISIFNEFPEIAQKHHSNSEKEKSLIKAFAHEPSEISFEIESTKNSKISDFLLAAIPYLGNARKLKKLKKKPKKKTYKKQAIESTEDFLTEVAEALSPSKIEENLKHLKKSESFKYSVAYGGNLPLSGARKNIYVGVSLGVTPLDSKVTGEYLRAALQSPKEKIPILLGDELDRFNQHAFRNKSLETGKATQEAINFGDRYESHIREVIQSLPHEQQSRFQIVRWSELKTDGFKEKVDALKSEYKTNAEFAQIIESTANEFFLKRAAGKKPKAKRLQSVKDYIIEELPLLLDGLKVDGQEFRTSMHPVFSAGAQNHDNPLAHLVTEISTSPKYESLRKKMKLEEGSSFIDLVFSK